MRISKLVCILATVLLFGSSVFAQDAEQGSINGGVLNGKALRLPKPQYPEELKGSGASGTVRIKIVISEEGDVLSAEVLLDEALNTVSESEDGTKTEAAEPAHPLLQEAAREAALEAGFAPTQLNGNPVKVTGVLVYNFLPSAGQDTDATGRSVPRQISGGVLNGKATSLPRPPYPPAARAVNAEGTVTVQVLIDENGNVISANAVSGHPLLRAAAVEAARQATFSPTTLSGEPVKVSGVIVYNFVAPKTEN